ncbi:MAG: AraC family transcriptional regulator [Bacteroides sp.]|nr:AraC family transcriptional regulator [Bacteroides sp.]
MYKTAFIFDDVCVTPERQIGIHSHPQWELSHVVCGGGTRSIGDKSEPMVEGEVILIPPNIPHVWHFNPEITDKNGCIANITIFFDDNLLESLAVLLPEMKNSIDQIRMLTHAISYSGEILDDITAILHSMRGKTAEARLPYMFRLIMLMSHTKCSNSVGYNNQLTRMEQRLERIRTFCACNYARSISLDEIARYVGMNKSAFCTFMKRQTGKTFSEYMNEHRLKRAVERIKNTDDNIAEIAFSVGFANVTYFNRLFRAKYGCSPTAYRY